jgi:hypothetical protein
MAPWEQFEVTYHFNKDFSYDKKLVDQIISNRRSLDNQLFIDRLLGLLGVKSSKADAKLVLYFHGMPLTE